MSIIIWSKGGSIKVRCQRRGITNGKRKGDVLFSFEAVNVDIEV